MCVCVCLVDHLADSVRLIRLWGWESMQCVSTLNSPKFRRPGSWKEPHLLKLIPERKKLSVNVADMEQKSWRSNINAQCSGKTTARPIRLQIGSKPTSLLKTH